MSMEMLNLTGKVAVVTGAGSVTERRKSMGPVMATALHDAGAKVAGIDIYEEGLDRLAAELKSDRFLKVVADISSPEQCDAAIAKITKQFGAPRSEEHTSELQSH